MDKTLKFLKEITDLNGTPGQEHEVRKFMNDYMKKTADEVYQDNLGSVVAKKVGLEDGPKIVVAGHMDEVGFMVHYIDDKGFIKFSPLGGWWNQVMLAQQVTITTRENKQYHGVIGSTPPHALTPEERKNPVDIKKMYIDIGISSKEEAEKLGIRPGDMITPYIEFRTLADEKFLLAKAWDNRIGCAVAMEVLDNLKGEKHANVYYGVGTVQEEVGCRGAATSGQMINPDIMFAVDVGLSGDTPGAEAIQSKMGKGPIIHLMDGGTIGHRGLRDFVVEIAEELEIPYQLDILMGGGTDAARMHMAHDGAPSMSLGIPSRYIHSHTSMIHRDDYENTVRLMTEVVKRFDKEVLNRIVFD